VQRRAAAEHSPLIGAARGAHRQVIILPLLEATVDPAVDPAKCQLIDDAAPAPRNVAAPAPHVQAAPAKRKRPRPARARALADCPACTCGQRAAAEAVRKQNVDLEPKDRKQTSGHTYRCRPQCPVRLFIDALPLL